MMHFIGMNKKMIKLTIVLCSLAFFFGATNVASAGVYTFEDMIDYWNLSGSNYGQSQTLAHFFDSVYIGENDPLHYVHVISDSVNFAAGDKVTSAFLELDFTNDECDGTIFGISFEEYVSYAFDGGEWVELGEVDKGKEVIAVLNIALLNNNGQLVVDLKVTNKTKGSGAAWLDHSRLYGTAETASVPEPAPLLLMGISLFGLASLANG